jgi:hypothetical protein
MVGKESERGEKNHVLDSREISSKIPVFLLPCKVTPCDLQSNDSQKS